MPVSTTSRSHTVADPSSSDSEALEFGQNDPSATPALADPVDSLRRSAVIFEMLGSGALYIGSALVISLYVTGAPRLSDMATSSTAVLFMVMFAGCLACVPSWCFLEVLIFLPSLKLSRTYSCRATAMLIIFGKKPQKQSLAAGRPRRLRKSCPLCRCSLSHTTNHLNGLVAALYAVAGFILFVLLQDQQSFVSFRSQSYSLQNLASASEENCTNRWNRSWVIILAVGLVLLYHITLGFPVYRYTPRHHKTTNGGAEQSAVEADDVGQRQRLGG
ncbi:SPOSA6832_00329 [Sporobolomyces salmonicolor]|uniref:SPOSA6832_00329-mRNA-1:cds n=1 Tax=Sporidiobolus salmonicolor TaxID=5005 RepID=A0A0D6EG21_SPOSA|nr:SPOSA6832_00329 [Sporobolomyces salmonicolor]